MREGGREGGREERTENAYLHRLQHRRSNQIKATLFIQLLHSRQDLALNKLRARHSRQVMQCPRGRHPNLTHPILERGEEVGKEGGFEEQGVICGGHMLS